MVAICQKLVSKLKEGGFLLQEQQERCNDVAVEGEEINGTFLTRLDLEQL